jgi:hypothetical protein
MLVQFLRGTKPGVSLVAGFLFLIAWMWEGVNVGRPELGLYSLTIPGLVVHFVQALVLIGISIWLNQIVLDKQMMNRSQSFTLAFFLLLFIGMPFITGEFRFTLAMIAVIFSLQQLFGSYYQSFPSLAIFNASMGVALALLIAPEYYPIVLIVPFTMISFGHIEWRLWMIWLLGMASIFVLAYIFGMHTRILDHDFNNFLTTALVKGHFVVELKLWERIVLLFNMTLFIWALVELVFNLAKKKIFNRKLFQIQIAITVLTLIAVLVAPPDGLGALVLLSIPASIIFANLFHYFMIQRWFDLLLLFWLILLLSSLIFS